MKNVVLVRYFKTLDNKFYPALLEISLFLHNKHLKMFACGAEIEDDDFLILLDERNRKIGTYQQGDDFINVFYEDENEEQKVKVALDSESESALEYLLEECQKC